MSTKNKLRKKFEYRCTLDLNRERNTVRTPGQKSIGLIAWDSGTTEIDLNWFCNNQGRTLYMRRIEKSELPGIATSGVLQDATHVLVRYCPPDLRQRRVVPPSVNPDELDALPDSEALLELLWVASANPYGAFTVNSVLYPDERTGCIQ